MSELRRDPISGRWVILTPDHSRRPADFTPPAAPIVDASACPFCEGREAIAGDELLAWRTNNSQPNTPGWQVRVVPNREPALRVEGDLGQASDGLFQRHGGLGAHEVIIESPRHSDSWSTMSEEAIGRVLWAWRVRIEDLQRDFRLRSFVIVKNHGAAAGARQDHAHSQLVAYPFPPSVIESELARGMQHFAATQQCLFCDVIREEAALNQRVITADEQVIVLAPFAPRVPFETWVVPREHAPHFHSASEGLLQAVAKHLRDLIRRLDAALLKPPFNLWVHTAPISDAAREAFHWHIEVLPRLRPVSGVEWGSGVRVNPIPPEEAAQVLRDS